MLTIEED